MDNFPNRGVGSELVSLTLPPLTLETLRAYAEVSGDNAQAHIDSQAARDMGFPDAFAHGLLSMAWLGRLLTDQIPVHMLKSYSVRFTAPVYVGEVLICSGLVTTSDVVDGHLRLEIDLKVADDSGALKLAGKAVVAA